MSEYVVNGTSIIHHSSVGVFILFNIGDLLIYSSELKKQGYKQASLSVQKINYAFHMYSKLGFVIIDENDEEYIMLYKL